MLQTRAILWLALVTLLAAGRAEAQFGPVVREVAQFSSAGTVGLGSHVGLAGIPNAMVLAVDYDYSLTGPMHLDVGGEFGFSGAMLLTRLLAGVKYKLFLPDLAVVPYLRLDLIADTRMDFIDEADAELVTGVGVRAGGGVRYFVDDTLGFGAELDADTGIAGGSGVTGMMSLTALVGAELLFP